MPRKKADYHLKRISFSICLPRYLKDELDEVARDNGFSRSEVITGLVKDFVRTWKQTDQK